MEGVVGDRQQVGVLGGHERAHEADLTVGHGREVVPGVVALVEDDRDRGRLHAEGLQAGDQLGQRRLEDLDVGSVARHGGRDEGDAVIRRAGQREAHQPQVEALVLGMAPLSDRGLWIGAGDVGVEVRAVEDQSLDAGPGDVIVTPAGTAHSYEVLGDEPARVVVAAAPPEKEGPENDG